MSNFKAVFLQGQEGRNLGLTTGIPALDKATYGILKKTSIGIAAAPKVGKTTFVDFCYLLSPYLQLLKENKLDNVEWIYLSGEVDRVSKEFKIVAFFMYYDYGAFSFIYKGKTYEMSDSYLMGRVKHYENDDDTEGELIKVTPEHMEQVKDIYINRIIPLFGQFDESGRQITKGKITFIEAIENPTGINKFLYAYAKKNGSFVEENFTVEENGVMVNRKRITGYTEKNPDKYTIIITDHIRKLQKERGFGMKENIDKWLEYSTFLRNICNFTFIHICHSNRNVANTERLKMAGEHIFPTGDDVKDTGNLSEEVTIFMSLFNPADEKYNLTKHFGHDLADYPNYRSIHITESRINYCPFHIFTTMFGNVNLFTPLNPF